MNREIERECKEIMQFFGYAHLPDHLKVVSQPFHDIANDMNNRLPVNFEKISTLRKILEAKDAAVRTVVAKND